MKKILIFAAILMALALVFVACKDPEQPENPADSTVESTPETPTEDPTEPPTDTDPGTDTDPVDPGTDTDPVDPGTDTDPVDPGTDTDPVDPGTDTDPGDDVPPVDPNAPLHMVAPDFLANYASQTGNLVCCSDLGTCEVITEGGRTFIRLTSAGGDPYIAFVDGGQNLQVGRYMAVSYRTDAEADGQFFMGSGQGWTGAGDSFMQTWVKDGQWQLAIIDLENVGVTSLENLVLNYARLDFFTGDQAGKYFDVEYIGFFNSAEAAQAYDFEQHKAPAWDASKDVVTHLSFDQLYTGTDAATNDTSVNIFFTPGQSTNWDGIADVTAGGIDALTFWGWVGVKGEVGQFGYQVNGGSAIYDDAWTVVAGQDVIAAAATSGADNASRMKITISLAGLEGENSIRVLYKSADGAEVCLKEFTLKAPVKEPVVPEAPAETFTPETFAQPTIEEIKAGYTYDIGAGQFFQTITGKCTYVDLTTLNAGFQSFLQSAGFGQYAYYADDHISIAPPMTGEKLIVTMKVYDLQGDLATNPNAFLLLNMTGGAQNSAQCNPVIEADPEIPGLYTLTFTEIVPGNTDELKFYMTTNPLCKLYIASLDIRIYIPSEDPNFTNLNFDSDVNSNFADDQNDKDPKVSDLANLFDQIIYAAGDPMFVTYNGGNPYYHVAGFSALHTRPVGNYAFTVNVVGTEGAEGFAGLFVRGYQNATNEKSFFGSDGNDNGSSYGGSGIYVNYLRRGVDYVVRINIKTYADGIYTPHIYYVPVDSSEITFVDDGSVVTILAGGKKVATVEIIGTKDYGMEGVAADALSEKVILTLADGTVEELIDAVVATSVPASDLGIGTRTGVINFNRVSLKPADSVEIPADFYLPAERVNVAQGKPVSSDSVENDTNIASNATDGNEGTRWGATPNGVANLIVDLEAVYALDEILGYFENASWQYEVAISVDGNAYDVIYQGNPHGSIVVSIPVNADARFIKFTRLDDSANADPHWFSLYEVYAFGTLKDVEPANPNGTLEAPLTVTEALAATADLAPGTTSADKYFAKGVVTSIGRGGNYYSNVYFTDGTSEMLIYTLNPMSGMGELKVGDTITVHGFIKNYSGTIEFASNGSEYVYIVAYEAA